MALHILVRRNYGGKSLVSIKCYSFRSFNFLLTLKDFNCILSTGTISIDLQKVFDTIDHNTSVVSQKGESQNMFQENKARQIFRKTNIFYHLICTCTCAYQVVKNVRFSENLTFFVFLKHLL